MGSMIPLYAPTALGPEGQQLSISPPKKRPAAVNSTTSLISAEPPRKKPKRFSSRGVVVVPSIDAPPPVHGRWLALSSTSTPSKSHASDKEKVNTVRTNNWAVNAFQEWKNTRNLANPKEYVPDDILDQEYGLDGVSIDPLVHWLSVFFDEVRSRDGRSYPPMSLQGMLFAIVRTMRQKNPPTPNFMNRKDFRFKVLHDKIDSAFSDYEEQGNGSQKRPPPHMTSITLEQENNLWEQGILGTDSPLKLLRAVFYHMSRVFFIKGATKHRYLKLSQFRRDTNPDCYTYIAAESGSKKKKSYGIQVNSRFFSFPPVYHANPVARERCLVYLLDLYISKLPGYASKEDVFYLRPMAFAPNDTACPWYEPAAVGLEKLRLMARNIFDAAGILSGRVSDSASLRLNELPTHQEKATEVCQVFNSSMPEMDLTRYLNKNTIGASQERLCADKDAPLELCESQHEQATEASRMLSYDMPTEFFTHEVGVLQLHEGPSSNQWEEAMETSPTSLTSSDQSKPKQNATVVSNIFTSEKNGSELHIYESGCYCIYICLQRRRNRRSRQRSCPPSIDHNFMDV